MATLTKAAPIGQQVNSMMAAGTLGSANALQVPQITIEVPLSTGGSTANAAFISWINPEPNTILVTDVIMYFSTTGTGTYDAGIQSDGTGSANDIFQAGTMNNLNYAVRAIRGLTGTEGAGSGGKPAVFRLGPGGTGTNNSIVAKTAETATTAIGKMYITYIVTTR